MTSLHRVGMLFAIWLVVGGVGQAERASWTTSKLVGSPDPPPPFSAEDAFPNLSFDPPVEIAHVPGTNQIFVAQRDGKILTFANRKDCDQSDVVLDLKNRHSNMEDCYSLTFHPDFATNHYMYVCYTRDLEVDGTFVSRFTLSSLDPPAVDVESEVVILRWLRGGHNGCCLKFGPDGFLYISSGDGGAPNPPDPQNAGQDLTRLLSKILRIDVDHPTDGLAYRVPEDNPFVGVSNVRPETWAYGLRNPWRMSFDRATGDLWVGDVGWQLWEMVYRIEKGGNYGWSVMEGPQPARPELERGPTPILPPIVSHPHSEAASVTGGYIYHGQKFPELRGAYIYGDFQSGKVWALRYDGKQVTFHQEIAQTPIGIVAFAEAPDGELLLLDHGPHNKIFELVRNRSFGQQSEFPKRLSETGLFQSTVDLSPAAGVRELQVNAKHWADGTVSQRWMAVPGSAPIQVRDNGRWILPEGSALVKTISMPLAHEGVTSLRRLETQLLLRDGGAWHPYSYQWNEQQTDAVLVPAGGTTMPLSLTPAASATNASERTHRIVSRAECQMCHNAWASLEGLGHGTQSASPLSIHTSQLNRPETHDGRSENQMTILQREGWLDPEMVIDSHATDRLVDPYDESQDLDRRVRSYLDVNCAHCHLENAGGTAMVYLPYKLPLDQTNLVNVRPTQGTFGISGAKLVAAADPFGSVLYYRINKTGNGRMPRLGSDEVDQNAVRMIHDWILSLPPSAAIVASEHDANSFAAAKEAISRGDEGRRTEAIGQLLSSTRGALALADWISRKTLPIDTAAQAIAIGAQHASLEVRDVFEQFLPPEQRIQRLGSLLNSAELLARPADAERGRAIFFRDGGATCKSCHRVSDEGSTLGPELNKIGSKYTRTELLTHLLEPSKFIDTKYVLHLLETADGRVVSGLVTSRDDNEIVLRNAQNEEIRTATADVESLVPQAKSLMPDLLLRDLTMQQAADLLAFLESLK